jgi:hypothetical protein
VTGRDSEHRWNGQGGLDVNGARHAFCSEPSVTVEQRPTIIVGIFADETAAHQAQSALADDGLDPDTVSVVALRNVDTHTLSALTDSSPEEWDTHLASLGESLVLVSDAQARQAVERVLRQHGAREILASDDQFAAETTAEP